MKITFWSLLILIQEYLEFGSATIKVQILEYAQFGHTATEITIPDAANNSRLSLVCSGFQPLQMVYDYQLNGLKEIYFPGVDQYIERISHDFSNSSTYEFKAFMNTRIVSFLQLRTIQCKTIQDATSSMNIVKEVQFVKNGSDLVVSLVEGQQLQGRARRQVRKSLCHVYCDGRDSAQASSPRDAESTNIHSRVITLVISDADKMAYARIENGKPGDEVWLDRSFDGGNSCGDGCRLEATVIPPESSSVSTPMYNFDDVIARRFGDMRVCGKAVGQPDIICTLHWMRAAAVADIKPKEPLCNIYCDGRDSAGATAPREAGRTGVFGRVITLVISDDDGMGYARIEGSQRDEVWLDRTIDGVITWGVPRLGQAFIPAGSDSVSTQMFNFYDKLSSRIGDLRACGKAGDRRQIECTNWARAVFTPVLQFEVKASLNGAAWKCIPDAATKSDAESPRLQFAYCYTSLDCNNLLRSTQSQDTAVRVLNSAEPCIDCSEAFKYISDEKKYHPQLAICTYKNTVTAVPYFFSFPPDGNLDSPSLYLSWNNDARGEEMLFIEKPASTNFSVGDTLGVSCMGMKYWFSRGYRVGIEMNGRMKLKPQGPHKYKRDKLRNAYIVKESITLEESGPGIVYCFGPVINSTEWINKSYTIWVNEKSPNSGASDPAQEKDSRNSSTLLIVGLVSGMVVLILAMAFVFLHRLRHVERKFARLTDAEIRDFREGILEDSGKEEEQRVENELKIESLPYNPNYEVPRKQISFDGKTLGAGTYGVVLKGVVWLETELTPVAFKTVRPGVELSYLKALLSELKILAYLNNEHEHVVHLIAACTEDIRKKEVFVGVELCTGSLLEALRASTADRFMNLVENGKLCEETSMMTSKRTRTSYENVPLPPLLSTRDLMSWSYQIAEGMEFLSQKKVIHGDLAARNILLTEARLVKICDFGLARQLVDYNYVKSEQCPLPWKWMAVESLASMNFSVKSDVWSFGVTLWEMFSLGQVPYPGLNWTTDFVQKLSNGLRMSCPEYATHEMYELMVSCWHLQPKERPSFTVLKEFFLPWTGASLGGDVSHEEAVEEGYVNAQP